jgi:hypothetical protein
MSNRRLTRIFVGENMAPRLFDQHKSPRNLPRKSTANESVVLTTRIGPAESAYSSNRALLKKACLSDETFRPMAARMESGTKNETRPWPGVTGLMFKRLIAFRPSPLSSTSHHSKGFGDMGGGIRLGLSRFISPNSPLVLCSNRTPQ